MILKWTYPVPALQLVVNVIYHCEIYVLVKQTIIIFKKNRADFIPRAPRSENCQFAPAPVGFIKLCQVKSQPRGWYNVKLAFPGFSNANKKTRIRVH